MSTQGKFLQAEKSLAVRMRKYIPFYIMALFPIIQFAVFHYAPMWGVVVSFKDFKAGRGIMGSEWVGLANYVKVFSDKYFYTVLGNTLRISFVSLIISFPVTVTFAMLINEIAGGFFKRTVQTISYLPYFLSWVVVGVFVYQMLSPVYGPVNAILLKLNIIDESIFFMVQQRYFLTIYVISNLWKNLGYGVIIYLAAISGINPELYESAKLDGANRSQNAIYITLPSIATTISTMLILSMSSLISVGFDPIFNLYNETTRPVADVISTYVYRKGVVNSDFAYASAVGLFQNIVSLALILVSNFVAKKVSSDYQII